MIGSSTKKVRSALLAATMVLATALALVTAAGASASVTGAFSEFHCQFTPEFVSLGKEAFCLHAETTGGAISIGGLTVPIANNPDTVDFAFYEPGLPGEEGYFIQNPVNGQVLGGPAQNVPGGLLGLLGSAAGGRQSSVTAGLEAAGSHTPGELLGPSTSALFPEQHLLEFRPEPALLLPVKIHLHNAFLGPNCYIGSDTKPIELSLYTGNTSPPLPNHSIRGRTLKAVSFQHQYGTTLLSIELVGNAFSVPVATGCGASQAVLGHETGGLLDGAINHKLGLPLPGGRSTAIVDTNTEINQGAQLVRFASE